MKTIKKLIIPSVYVLSVLTIVGSVFFVVNGVSKYLSEEKDYNYSVKGVFEEITPVIKEEKKTTVIKPFISENVSIGKNFYDYEGEISDQENALIYYENTYIQNSGIDYTCNETFDVVAILEGEVIEITEDETLGNIVKIKHSNELVSIYEGIEGLKISKGDAVNQGQIIGVSGTSKINEDYNSYLHFEIYYNGEVINPEDLYSLSIGDF